MVLAWRYPFEKRLSIMESKSKLWLGLGVVCVAGAAMTSCVGGSGGSGMAGMDHGAMAMGVLKVARVEKAPALLIRSPATRFIWASSLSSGVT